MSMGSCPCLKPSLRAIDMFDPVDAILSESGVSFFMGPAYEKKCMKNNLTCKLITLLSDFH